MFSGDRLSTGQGSRVTVFTSAGEGFRLGPEGKARLRKDGDTTVVILEQGILALQTGGHTQVALASGVTVRSRGGSPATAEVTTSDSGAAQVRALRGSVEVVSADQSVVVQRGELALIVIPGSASAGSMGAAAPLLAAQETAGAEAGAVSGTVADRNNVVVQGAQITLTGPDGVAYAAESNEVGLFRFVRVPPGRYRLRVTKRGMPDFALPDVVVLPGQETSLGVIALRGGGRKSNTGVIIGVVAAAVGGGLGAALALGGGDGAPTTPLPPISPSNP